MHGGDEGVAGFASAASLNRTGVLAKLDRNKDQRHENADPSNELFQTCEFVE